MVAGRCEFVWVDCTKGDVNPSLKQFLPDYDLVTAETYPVNGVPDKENKVKTASWFLQVIGTLPDHRKQGCAGALIDVIKEKAGGTVLCLETQAAANASYSAICYDIALIFGAVTVL